MQIMKMKSKSGLVVALVFLCAFVLVASAVMAASYETDEKRRDSAGKTQVVDGGGKDGWGGYGSGDDKGGWTGGDLGSDKRGRSGRGYRGGHRGGRGYRGGRGGGGGGKG